MLYVQYIHFHININIYMSTRVCMYILLSIFGMVLCKVSTGMKGERANNDDQQ